MRQALELFRNMDELRHPYIFQQVLSGRTTDFIFAVRTRRPRRPPRRRGQGSSWSLAQVYSYAIEQSLFVHLRAARRFPDNVGGACARHTSRPSLCHRPRHPAQ